MYQELWFPENYQQSWTGVILVYSNDKLFSTSLLTPSNHSETFVIDTIVMTVSSHLSTLANSAAEKFGSESVHYALQMQADFICILIINSSSRDLILLGIWNELPGSTVQYFKWSSPLSADNCVSCAI